MFWEVMAFVPMVGFCGWISWTLWFKPYKPEYRDEDYGDLAYSPKPDVVMTDRMDELMSAIRALSEMPVPETLDLRCYITGVSATALQQKWQYERQFKTVWELADEIATDGRFHVKHVEMAVYQAQESDWIMGPGRVWEHQLEKSLEDVKKPKKMGWPAL